MVGADPSVPQRAALERVTGASSQQQAQTGPTESGMNTSGKPNPQDVIARLNDLSDAKPPAPDGYSSKITETSHESVNHVRRLAMKKKRNDR